MAFDAFDKSFGHGGAYAVSIALADISNRAVIEKAVDLDILRNYYKDFTFTGAACQVLSNLFRHCFGTFAIFYALSQRTWLPWLSIVTWR